MLRMGIDVGGTFTDLVLVDDTSGELWSLKVPTTPADPSLGAIGGVRRLLELSGRPPAELGFIGHGTTIATNMVIEGRGAKTALLATKGFRDLLETRRTARHDRADLYDMFFPSPPPLVPRHWRVELNERVLHDGTVQVPLDEAHLRAQVQRLRDEGVEAIAIALLNSYANPAHEIRATEICREVAPALFVTPSHEVNPEMFEYERTSSTVMNAMLGPRCGGYINSFVSRLEELGVHADLQLMQSNGGLTKPEFVAQRPVNLLESGPAGGVSAVVKLVEGLGLTNALLGDMGGTSFDVSLVRNSEPEVRTSTMLDSYIVRVPTIDIVSIGAGGGSIAWIDEGGGVRIGPKSAAADPGPACYGRGGKYPTVTDCNLVLGYVDAERFLGGEFRLDVDAAHRVIKEHLADKLGVSVVEAARTVREVTNAPMAQAIRLVTIERGYDPRDFAYVPYGGAGPVHAVDLAAALDIPKVVVPPLPGLLSAVGMLVADQLYDAQSSAMEVISELDPALIEQRYGELENEVRSRLSSSGAAPKRITVRRMAECKYLSQAETLTLPLGTTALHADGLKSLEIEFEREHQRLWNFVLPGSPVTLVNLRVRGQAHTGIPLPRGDAGRSRSEASLRHRQVWMDGDFADLPCHQRASLEPGRSVDGPAIFEEHSSSIVIHAGHKAHVDGLGNLIVDLGASK